MRNFLAFSFFFLFLVMLIPFQDYAFAQIEAKKLTVNVDSVRLQELENSNVLRVELNILNGGDEEASFFSGNFDLLDTNLRQYGTTSGYDLREKGESISRGACDTLFGDNINPGLSIDLEVCFEVPKSNFKYDSILIYENIFLQDMDTAKIIPLVKSSVAYDTLVNKIEPKNDAIADRVDDLESQGGCLIATAAYGTELAPEVQNLREIRNKMYETEIGGDVMYSVNNFYYSFSPTVSDWERENIMFKDTMRLLITPSMTSFTILDHQNINSEEGLIGYVISIVALNVGMYFVAPIIIIHKIRKFAC
jgi:hypothetical protein